ncbi:MAG: hypothetical protein GY782_11035 [Gammaproteobacteria bacterium]|nr:hypothetical protein [Gammaproteobacteria bacterium]
MSSSDGASSVFSFNHDNVPSKSIYIVKVVNHKRQLVKTISDIKPLIYP